MTEAWIVVVATAAILLTLLAVTLWPRLFNAGWRRIPCKVCGRTIHPRGLVGMCEHCGTPWELRLR